jgi:hypothetical protein
MNFNKSEILRQEYNTNVDIFSHKIKAIKLEYALLKIADIRDKQDMLKQFLKEGNILLTDLEKIYNQITLENELYVEKLKKAKDEPN